MSAASSPEAQAPDTPRERRGSRDWRPLEGLARALLLLVGGAAGGGLTYLLALSSVLQLSRLLGFLMGATPEQVAANEVLFGTAAIALGALVLGGAWTFRMRRHLGLPTPTLTLQQTLAVLDAPATALLGTALALGVALAYGRLVFLYHRLAGGVDEGMYLYAAREVMSGRVAYRDFPFIQGPLHPYLLAVFLAPFSFDEGAARLFALSVMMLTLVVVAATAARLSGTRVAAPIAVLLLVTNLDFLTDQTSGVHPSGATGGLLVAVSALLLAYRQPVLAILPLAIVTGTRVLFAPLAILGVLAAAVILRDARRPLLVGAAAATAMFGPFLVADPRSFWFDVIGHQSQRATILARLNEGVPDTLRTHLVEMQRAGLVMIGSYGPLLVALVVAGTLLAWRPAREKLGTYRTQVLAYLVVAAASMFLVDLLPYPFLERYPVPQLPLAAIAGGTAFGVFLHLGKERPELARLVIVLAAAVLLANPFQATREPMGAPNFVELNRKSPPVAALRELADIVRSVTPPEGVLITLETPVAVQAGRALWPGLGVTAWGVLSVPDEDAVAVKMTTPKLLAEAIESKRAAAVVASDRYTWDLPRLPNKERIRRFLDREYRVVSAFEKLNDWGITRVYVPNP